MFIAKMSVVIIEVFIEEEMEKKMKQKKKIIKIIIMCRKILKITNQILIIIIIFNIKCHMKSKLNNLNTHIIKIRIEKYPYKVKKKMKCVK